MKVAILGIDGYLGWPLSLKLKKLGHKVCGVDNLWRRDKVKSIVPIDSVKNRFKNKSFYEFNIEEDIIGLKSFLEIERPDIIVHYAEIPSAPYSMIGVEEAIEVQKNNVLGTLGLLWLMKEVTPHATLIKLGTMGEYGTPNRPLFEGEYPKDAFLKWRDREWNLGGQQTNRDAGSFYHVSKVQDTANIFAACKFWGLKSYDVMQGIIYGVHTTEINKPKLRTRFDIDESFGTIINRFVSQAILGIPLTIYGTGGQTRGVIALEDAMQCMVKLINSPLKKGEYKVVNQISGVYKMKDLANKVIKVAKEFDIKVKKQFIENPRVEASEHKYEVISDNLPALGFKPVVTVEEEIREMFKVLSKSDVKKQIELQKDFILPKIKWRR